MKSIFKYNLELSLATEEDANVIISMRTDELRSRYISSTDPSLEKQIDWLRKYKEREALGQEYYFIAIDEEGEKFASYRIYNIQNYTAEIGSWVTKPNYDKNQNSIKLDLAMKEFVFEELGFEELHFEVRKENKSVLRYHKMFSPEVVKESEMDVFFILKKENYYKERTTKFKNIK